MTKEEILEKSRNDNKNLDAYDLEIQRKASVFAFCIGIILICIIFPLLAVFKKEYHYELFMIFNGMEAGLFGYKYIKMRKKHELLAASLYTIAFLMFTVAFIMSFFA